MSFEIDIEGLDAWEARFAKAPQIVKEEMVKAVDLLTFAGQSISQSAAPVDTGTLRRSITQQKATFAGGGVTGAWGTNIPYAKYQEYGTRYIKPRSFMQKGRITVQPRVRPAFEAAASRIAARIGGG